MYLLLPHWIGFATSLISSSSLKRFDGALPVMKFQHDKKNHNGEMKRNMYHPTTQATSCMKMCDTFIFLSTALYDSSTKCTNDSLMKAIPLFGEIYPNPVILIFIQSLNIENLAPYYYYL